MLRIPTVLLLLLLSITLGANVITWEGDKSEDWHDPLNWDSNTVPIAGDDVVIDGNTTVNLVSNSTIKTLVLSNGAMLSLDDSAILTLQADGLFSNRIDILGGSNLVVIKGEIRVESGDIIAINIEDGNLTNSGNINIIEALQRGILIDTDGQLENEGEITITRAGINGLLNLGILNNQSDGKITLSKVDDGASTAFLSGLLNFTTGTLTNYGDITIDSTGRKSLDNKGTLTNNATIAISNASVGLSSDHKLENNGSITLTKSTSVNFINNDTLLNKGSFIINETTTTAIDNKGPIINEGSMNINAGSAVGIINNSSIITTSTSSLSVTSDIQAITNRGVFTNRGTLDCMAGTGSGVFNDSLFVNLGGTINISSSGQGIINNPDDSVAHIGTLNLIAVSIGILNQGMFDLTGMVDYNYPDTTTVYPISIGIDNRSGATLETGRLLIHNFSGTGINNSGILKIKGKLDIYDFRGLVNNGIRNSGVLTAIADNAISIINSPVINTTGIQSSGTISLDGSLYLTQGFTNAMIIDDGITTIGPLGFLGIRPTSLTVNMPGELVILGQLLITDEPLQVN